MPLARLRELPPELRHAGIAAAALAASLILPWYQKSFVPQGSREFVQDNLSAFGVFSFVEAAVLLVAGGVLFLVWARSERKGFHLPGGDGAAILAAGAWAILLLVWRLFDKPDVDDPGATVGIQWGIFGALLAAGALTAAGARVRAAHRPEPPNPAAEPEPPRPPRPPRRPADRAAFDDAFQAPPEWSGEPPEAPRRGRATRRSDDLDSPTAPTRRSDDLDSPTAPTRRSEDIDPSAAPTRRVERGDEPLF
jgi:hypothetical protein